MFANEGPGFRYFGFAHLQRFIFQFRKLINIHEINQKAIAEVDVNLNTSVNDIFIEINKKLNALGLVRLDNQVSPEIQLQVDADLMGNLFVIITENAVQYRPTAQQRSGSHQPAPSAWMRGRPNAAVRR